MPNNYDAEHWDVKRNGDGVIASNEILGASFEGDILDLNDLITSNGGNPISLPPDYIDVRNIIPS